MQHVDMKRLVAYLEEKQLITQLVSGSKLSEGNQAIRLGFDLKKVPEFTQFMEENGIWGLLGYSLHEGEFTYINGTCIKNVDATDAQVLSDAEIKLRLQVKQLSDMLIRYRHHRTIRRRVWRCLFRHLRHANSSIYRQ